MLNRFQLAALIGLFLLPVRGANPQWLVRPDLCKSPSFREGDLYGPQSSACLCYEWFVRLEASEFRNKSLPADWEFEDASPGGGNSLDASYLKYSLVTESRGDKLNCSRFVRGNDLFEPCRFSIIAGLVFVRPSGEYWAHSESHLPLGRKLNWVGVSREPMYQANSSRQAREDIARESTFGHSSDDLLDAATVLISEPTTLILLGASLLVLGAGIRFKRSSGDQDTR